MIEITDFHYEVRVEFKLTPQEAITLIVMAKEHYDADVRDAVNETFGRWECAANEGLPIIATGRELGLASKAVEMWTHWPDVPQAAQGMLMNGWLNRIKRERGVEWDRIQHSKRISKIHAQG